MLKQSASYEQQIAKLLEHGCTISDEAFCEDVLSRVSYYRLSAYFLTFKMKDGRYADGTDFNKVYMLYEFDRKLRRLLFSVLEELEVYIRAQLSYYHTHKYGADGYLNPANFNYHHNHLDFASRLNDLVNSNDKLPFVTHHATKYHRQFPLWVIMELFTFGMLSYFYAEMLTPDQKRVAHNIFKASVSEAKSWLYCCTNLRNMCAHSRRLYNSVFSVIPAKIPNVDKPAERKLFAAIMAVRELYPDTEKWNTEFMPVMSALIDEYSEAILLKHIGFPQDWETYMRK
ncbi:MAG: Abi family protein [Defluviitaleaceae bacterium]|nr:Abi family protein [Defluviitaleaceae bacterium]MCL2274605.1 Abi family protein [Defluviitaleaceae bacterium]